MPAMRTGSYKLTPLATNPTSGDIVFAKAATANNYIVVIISANNSNGAPTWTPDPTWSVGAPYATFTPTTGQTEGSAAYYKKAAGGETKLSFTGITANAFYGLSYEVTGASDFDAAATVAAAGNAVSGGGTSSVSLTANGDDTLFTTFMETINSGQGTGTNTNAGTWGGGAASDFPFTPAQPSDAQNTTTYEVDFAVGTQTLASGSSATPTYTWSSINGSTTSFSRITVLAFKSTTSGGNTGHFTGKLYPSTTQDVNASTYKLSTAASTATSKTTVSVPALAVAITTFRFIPETAGVQASPAAAPDTFASGWSRNPMVENGDTGTLVGGTVAFVLNVTANQSLDGLTDKSTATVVVYQNNTEIARGTSAATAVPANTATSFGIPVAIPQTALVQNAAIKVSYFISCFNTNALNPTTVTMNYATTGTSVGSLNYTIQAIRLLTATVTATCTVARKIAVSMRLTATTTGNATMARTIAVKRVFTATVTGKATTFVQISTDVLARVAKGGTTVVKRIIAIFDD